MLHEVCCVFAAVEMDASPLDFQSKLLHVAFSIKVNKMKVELRGKLQCVFWGEDNPTPGSYEEGKSDRWLQISQS